jgi:hypothetical protein
MPASNAWDETSPSSGSAISLGDDAIRQLKLDIRERMAVQHYWNDSLATDGLHKTVSVTPATDQPVLKTTAPHQSVTGSSDVSLIDLETTWNTTGDPAAILVKVTDTASDIASLLMDLRVDGLTQFQVSKVGDLAIAGSFAAVGAIATSDTDAGSIWTAGGITAGPGIPIIGTDGRIPEISSVYFADLSGVNITGLELPDPLPARNASALTDLNASELDTGTVPDARLSSNVAKYASQMVFTYAGTNLVSGSVAGTQLFTCQNTNTGTAALAEVRASNATGAYLALQCSSSAYTGGEPVGLNGAAIIANASAGLGIYCTAASTIRFYTSGTLTKPIVFTDDPAIRLPLATTPVNVTADSGCQIYCKNDKLIVQMNDGGTARYKYLPLTGTNATWVHTTTAP